MWARAAMPKASLSQASDSTASTLTTSAQELPSAVLITKYIQSEVEAEAKPAQPKWGCSGGGSIVQRAALQITAPGGTFARHATESNQIKQFTSVCKMISN